MSPPHPDLYDPPLRGLYDHLLQTQPVPTRMATAACLAVLGDAVAQRSGKSCERYDARRAFSIVVVEATYRGIMQQPILMWIETTFTGRFLATFLSLPLPLLATAERVAFNMFVVSPWAYYPLYFAITGPLQGLTVRDTWRRAQAQFPSLFGINLCYWLPVQSLQFALVPPQYKVPFICLAGLVWNVILSALTGSARGWRRTEDVKQSSSSEDSSGHSNVVVVPECPSTGHVVAAREQQSRNELM